MSFYNLLRTAEYAITLATIEITALLVSLYILYSLKKNVHKATAMLSYNITITVTLAIFFAPFSNITFAWMFVVPATSIFLQGFKNSIPANIIFFVFILFYLFYLKVDSVTTLITINILLSYIVVLITVYVYQMNRDCINSKNKKLLDELAVKNNSLILLSITDSLTSLCNRTKIDEILENEIKQAKRHSTPLTIMMIDIDYFKYVNDTYGHQAGDTILKEFSDTLALNFRERVITSQDGEGKNFS